MTTKQEAEKKLDELNLQLAASSMRANGLTSLYSSACILEDRAEMHRLRQEIIALTEVQLDNLYSTAYYSRILNRPGS